MSLSEEQPLTNIHTSENVFNWRFFGPSDGPWGPRPLLPVPVPEEIPELGSRTVSVVPLKCRSRKDELSRETTLVGYSPVPSRLVPRLYCLRRLLQWGGRDVPVSTCSLSELLFSYREDLDI